MSCEDEDVDLLLKVLNNSTTKAPTTKTHGRFVHEWLTEVRTAWRQQALNMAANDVPVGELPEGRDPMGTTKESELRNDNTQIFATLCR